MNVAFSSDLHTFKRLVINSINANAALSKFAYIFQDLNDIIMVSFSHIRICNEAINYAISVSTLGTRVC